MCGNDGARAGWAVRVGLRPRGENDNFIPFGVHFWETEWVGLRSGLAEGLQLPKWLCTGPHGSPSN